MQQTKMTDLVFEEEMRKLGAALKFKAEGLLQALGAAVPKVTDLIGTQESTLAQELKDLWNFARGTGVPEHFK